MNVEELVYALEGLLVRYREYEESDRALMDVLEAETVANDSFELDKRITEIAEKWRDGGYERNNDEELL